MLRNKNNLPNSKIASHHYQNVFQEHHHQMAAIVTSYLDPSIRQQFLS
jgi:hypothetical protein